MKLAGRQKRKDADARSRALRRRFYKGAAIATAVYVGLSLIKFHAQLPYLTYELVVIWAVFLLCYASFKEVLRWNDVDDPKSYDGDFWAALVVVGAVWMIVWNIGRVWIFHLGRLEFPHDYTAATIETIVLYTISGISAFLHKRSKLAEHARRRNIQRKKSVRATKRFAEAARTKTEIMLAPESEIQVTLTSTPGLDEKEHKKQNS